MKEAAEFFLDFLENYSISKKNKYEKGVVYEQRMGKSVCNSKK
jgi:hypothetical protein